MGRVLRLGQTKGPRAVAWTGVRAPRQEQTLSVSCNSTGNARVTPLGFAQKILRRFFAFLKISSLTENFGELERIYKMSFSIPTDNEMLQICSFFIEYLYYNCSPIFPGYLLNFIITGDETIVKTTFYIFFWCF